MTLKYEDRIASEEALDRLFFDGVPEQLQVGDDAHFPEDVEALVSVLERDTEHQVGAVIRNEAAGLVGLFLVERATGEPQDLLIVPLPLPRDGHPSALCRVPGSGPTFAEV